MIRRTRDDEHLDERGAVAVMAALVVVVVLAATAFVVDIGMSRASARDMQAVADAVALDTARSPGLATCDRQKLEAAANTSLAGQGDTIGQDAPIQVIPGYVDSATNEFEERWSDCNAVKIVSSATVDYAFAPVIGTSNGTASRSAVGTSSPPAMCFSAGTKTLVLDTDQSALGPVLKSVGLRLGVDLVAYTGLVNLKDFDIPLADLNAALVAGTGNGLLETTNVSLGQFLLAQATALENNEDAPAAQVEVLQNLAGTQLSSLTVNIRDFLKLDTTGAAGLTADVNALDLFGGAIVAANGTNALKVSDLGLTLPGLKTGATANATIIEPPRIACGIKGATATSAQVRIDVKGTLLGSTTAIDVSVTTGSGTARLTDVNCSAAATPTVTIGGDVAAATVDGSVKLLLLPLVGLGGTAASGTGQQPFTYPATSGMPDPATKPIGGGSDLSIVPKLLGIPIPLDLVTNIVGNIVGDVLDLLGIRLGSMDVSVLGRPSCDGVRLVG